jgi:molybdopterin converting factor small subunit
MALVVLRAPLSELAGGRSHPVDGGTVAAVLQMLERERPSVRGWILDERGSVRRHVNVYVNGQLARDDTAVGHDDRVQVLPAITGG